MAKSYPQATEAEGAEKAPKIVEKSAEKVTKSAEKAKNAAENSKNAAKTAKSTDIITDKSTKKFTVGQKILLILGILFMLGGVACAVVPFFLPEEVAVELHFPEVPSKKADDHNIYSKLTGLTLTDGTATDAPTLCVQIPNGLDGGRPQVGLDQAGVVFEAIAEAGITRFAAIYQNPTSAVIGPVRSLRLYFLQWDTPFDCTIVHAGGAPDAVEAVSHGYRDLTENYTYMYRGTAAARRWNNLFTTADYLKAFNSAKGFTTSNVQGFLRMTPAEATRARIDAQAKERLVITEPAVADTSALAPEVSRILLNFGHGMANFNVVYNYNAATNSYDRSYESGAAHEAYVCPKENLGEPEPEKICTLTQVSPTVVIAMVVNEQRGWDGYHESITTTGTGVAYVFQNGMATRGTWVKGSVGEQIKFFDDNGTEIKLVPGQTWISAVPGYGGVEY